MNLADVLVFAHEKEAKGSAEPADFMESEQPRGLQRPQTLAESCGFHESEGDLSTERIENPQNPQAPMDSERLAITGFPWNPQNPQGSTPHFEKPLPVSVDYFASLGLELLELDRVFLERHLPHGTVRRNACIRDYIQKWQDSAQKEPLPQKQQNVGRRAANTWLRQSRLTTRSDGDGA